MSRSLTLSLFLLSAVAGAVAANVVPEAALLAVLLPPFLICIILGWVLTIQNGGLNFSLSGLIFPVKPLTKVQPSASLIAFGVSGAFALGACTALLVLAYA